MAPPYTPPFTVLQSFADLSDYLREEGVEHGADADAQVVELVNRAGPLVGTMLIRWEWERGLVQVIQAMIVDVAEDRVPEVERALARLNHGAPIAGFAIDPERRFVYFRTTLLRDDRGHLPVAALGRAIHVAIASAHDALPVVAPVARPEPAAA